LRQADAERRVVEVGDEVTDPFALLLAERRRQAGNQRGWRARFARWLPALGARAGVLGAIALAETA
jgi:hypothetical protein